MPRQSKKLKSAKSYRQMSAELEKLLTWFDEAEPDLDEALAKYEQVNELIADMEDYLKSAQIKIKRINSQIQ